MVRQLSTNPISRIRVGFVMHVMQVAGAEVLVKQIIERLADSVESTVFCLDGLGELGQQLLDAGTPVVVLNRKPGIDRSLVKRLAQETKDRNIEVLHAHQYTPFFYSALARLFGRSASKIIFTEHGRHYPDIVSWKRRWVNKLVLQRAADVATACCDFSAQAVRENEGIRNTITLPNGVDLAALPARGGLKEKDELRQRLGLEPGGLYAACVARFHPVKDHRTLMRAWQHVVRSVPQAKLLLVGDGPERAERQAQARELGIASNVEFWGIRHDIADILRAVDVFTLSSVSEAASLTLLEAMASQCPSVITNVGGNGEHVLDGEHGFLVPRGDDVQLGHRLCQLLQDRALASKFGDAARRRVIERFDLSKVIDQYAGHFARLSGRAVKRPT